jgi:hypothetical protein
VVALEREHLAPHTGPAFNTGRVSRRSIVAKLFFVVFSVALLGTLVSGQSKHESLQGAWQTVEVTMTGPDARTIAIPEPRANLLVFTARHYSQIHLNPEGPTPVFARDAGSYEARDGVITMRPVVARAASAMAPGAFITYSYRLDGNTLWVTFQKNQDGPIVNPATIKAVRVE